MNRYGIAALFVLGVLALAACGDDEPGNGGAGAPDTSEQAPQADGAGRDTPTTDNQRSPDGDRESGPAQGAEPDPEESPIDDSGAEAEALPGAVDPRDVSALKLGASQEVALNQLGGEPVDRSPGPGGTTCHEFRVRPPKGRTDANSKRLRAQLCFKGGKLRGASVVSKPPSQKTQRSD